MAEKAQVKVTAGLFNPGDKVALFPRSAGGPLHRGLGHRTPKTVDKNGEVEFDNLAAGATFYVAKTDEDGPTVAVTAKQFPAERKRESAASTRETLAATRPDETNKTVVTGARTTASTGRLGQQFVSSATGSKSESGEVEEPGQPRQENHLDEPQRSATVTGLATTVKGEPPAERVPQSEARKKPQASATESGEAAPREPEEDPAEHEEQDDAKRTPQRSATEEGASARRPKAEPPEAPGGSRTSTATGQGRSAPTQTSAAKAAARKGSSSRSGGTSSGNRSGNRSRSGGRK